MVPTLVEILFVYLFVNFFLLDPLHSITNQELFEKYPYNPRIPHQKKEMDAPQLYQLSS